MIDINVLFSNRYAHASIQRVWIWAKIWANYKTRPIIGRLFHAYLFFSFLASNISAYIAVPIVLLLLVLIVLLYRRHENQKKWDTSSVLLRNHIIHVSSQSIYLRFTFSFQNGYATSPSEIHIREEPWCPWWLIVWMYHALAQTVGHRYADSRISP